MKLTNPDAWNVYAGGTFAASDRNSYDVVTPLGKYTIQPVSHKYNVEKHIGYVVYFLNEKGKLPGGLWQPLKGDILRPGLATLPEARRLCQQHAESH
jgi:hypothetical protein